MGFLYFVLGLVIGVIAGVLLMKKYGAMIVAAITSLETTIKNSIQRIESAIQRVEAAIKAAKGIIGVLLLALLFGLAGQAQTTTPAPASCAQSPCWQQTWVETSATAATPGTATVGICIGGSAGCGTPDVPGTNGWVYLAPESSSAGVAILPGLSYGAQINTAVRFAWTSGGAPSAWSPIFQTQIGQAPPVVAAPGNLGGKQLQARRWRVNDDSQSLVYGFAGEADPAENAF